MSYPNPNQQYQYPYPGFVGQSYQQPLAPQGDYRYSQVYPAQHDQTSASYIQRHEGMPNAFVAELPGSIPTGTPLIPALSTTTPAKQLSEDEQLAQQLQQIEVEEANERAISTKNLSQRRSFVGVQQNLQNSASQAYQQEQLTRPHVLNASSNNPYKAHLPSQLSPSLLPEVVSGPHPTSGTAYHPSSPSSLPEVVAISPQIAPSPHIPQRPQFLPTTPDPAALSAYLELHRQVPYPPQWVLPPVTSTFYGAFEHSPKSDFLDILESQTWRTTRFSKTSRNPPPPAFKFIFKEKGGNFRDPQHSWTMTVPAIGKADVRSTEWNYHVKRDKHTGMRKSEGLQPPRSKVEILTTYVPGVNYDALRFHGPDGCIYMWVTQAPFGSVRGSRYDTLRHALFVSDQRTGVQDPLYGQIVADHTYWDGFIDTADIHEIRCSGCNANPINGLRWKCKTCPEHNACESCRISSTLVTPACRLTLVSLPDEALYIRNPTVDIPMVVATLQVLKDWQMHMLREQRRTGRAGFKATVEAARKGELGRMRYWNSSDFDERTWKGEDIPGTVLKAVECMQRCGEGVLRKPAPLVGDVEFKQVTTAKS